MREREREKERECVREKEADRESETMVDREKVTMWKRKGGRSKNTDALSLQYTTLYLHHSSIISTLCRQSQSQRILHYALCPN